MLNRVSRWIVPLTLVATPVTARAQGATAAPPVTVDTAALMRDVRVLSADSMEGRAVGTPGGAKARTYLLRRFGEVGIQPLGTSYEMPFTFAGRGGERRGVNIVGVIRGRSSPERFIGLTAHYDHVGVRDGNIFNGADDNASGTSALLEIAKYLRQNPPAHSVIIAALDAEESGLRGARAFVENPPVEKSAILANLNMDMVSRNAAGELWVAGTHHYPKFLPFVERVGERAAVKLRIGHDRPNVPGQDDWTTSSDHGPFHGAGIPFLYVGVEDHEDYHRATDDAERIQPDFYGRSVATIIDLLRELDAFLTTSSGRAP